MNVLVLGNGAREHALAWKLSTSRVVHRLFAAPGNAGTATVAQNLPQVNPLDPPAVVAACRANEIDLVFVGPETPLEAGVVDALRAEGIDAIGPDRRSAQLESSKTFSKDFMVRHRLPTARAREFTNPTDFEAYLPTVPGRLVIKKSGLAAGKGVLETDDRREARDFGLQILKTDALLVEEFLTGWEISVFVLSDGQHYTVLPPTADFKKAREGDQGPNTGGMGAICPVPSVSPELWKSIQTDVVEPTMAALNADGLNYRGVLFIGVMVTASGPQILEFNVRFGDPETQSLLTFIRSDFGELVQAMAQGTLDQHRVDLADHVAVGVVIAAPGYPGSYPQHLPVTLTPPAGPIPLFHAGTELRDGVVVTTGGRCFTAVGVGATFDEAQRQAYEGARRVAFDGAWFRTDIGDKFYR